MQMLYQHLFDFGQHRLAVLLTLLATLFGTQVFGLGFNGVELAYGGNKLRRQLLWSARGFGDGGFGFDKVTARVCPACVRVSPEKENVNN